MDLESKSSWSTFTPTPFAWTDTQNSMFSHSSKRQREQEEQTVYNEDSIRERKKHRPLPLRSSPRSRQRSNTIEAFAHSSLSALTPVQSSDDEDDFNKCFPFESTAMKAQQLLQTPQALVLDLDVSMDMDASMDNDDNSPLAATGFDTTTQQSSAVPHSFACQSLRNGHFASIPFGLQQSMLSTAMVAYSQGSPGPNPELSRDTPWWRSPRLRSPVSDNGDAMTSNKNTSGDAEMAYDLSPSESSLSTKSSSMEAEAAEMRKRLSSLDLPDQGNAEPTSKPVAKLAFSMGYRADCDKCRRRVPGHYSHIIKC
ncbi:hypothetical protein BDW59DRAFT_43606 [Aspergillus cavernicola]|uniref:Uncharacterized protein n=1 Tax=Aspergillus cavernicola TaxID=176166 RepID=A0ABR4ILZ0_9EURO